jgi:RING-type zinc-finger/B-box zinc finger
LFHCTSVTNVKFISVLIYNSSESSYKLDLTQFVGIVPDYTINMTAAESRDVQTQLSNITECPVCADTYSDPRSLPCVHTYCLKCIKGFSKDKLPGDSVACPICRTEFTISEKGVDGLPKNFFIEQLKDIGQPVTSSIRCEGCDEDDENRRKQAVKFCIECQQKLCEACIGTHRRLRATKGHKLVEIGDEEGMRAAVGEVTSSYCDKHPEKALELYCFDCQAALCFMCFVEHQKSHECTDVNKVAGEFRQKMTHDVQKMAEFISKCREMLKKQEQQKKDFSSVLDGIEKEICKRIKQLKKIIDSEKLVLMQEIEAKRKERTKQIQHVVENVEQHISFATSLIKYTEEIRDKGTASDIAKQRNALHARTDELIKLDDINQEINGLGLLKVKFEAAKMPVTSSEKLVGQVHWQQDDGK